MAGSNYKTLKQIKFNRGQVSDKLSERVDMALNQACGTVYNDVSINRYGQIEDGFNLKFAAQTGGNNIGVFDRTPGSIPYGETLLCLFDTGTDKVLPVTFDGTNIKVYKALYKYNENELTDFSTAIAEVDVSAYITDIGLKVLQFGYNVIFYDQAHKPQLINILPGVVSWNTPIITFRNGYFDDAFDKIFARTGSFSTPAGFTVPTSGYYYVNDQTYETTKTIITIKRNAAGGNFTSDLVGQMIDCVELGGMIQVVEVQDIDTMLCRVLSPLIGTDASVSQIRIKFNTTASTSKFLFGFEQVFDNPNDTVPTYPDSAAYIGQRLIFGGNDKVGNIVAASRIGVLNDFNPESATDSDAWYATISSKEFCKIVDMLESDEELRIACTDGEYAVPKGYLNASGILQYGFSRRSRIGCAPNTQCVDIGGLIAYPSRDRTAIYITNYQTLSEKYTPASLTSQTSGITTNIIQLAFLRNREDDAGNMMVGLNDDGTMFASAIDTTVGLNGLYRIDPYYHTYFDAGIWKITKLFAIDNVLWGIMHYQYSSVHYYYLVRFSKKDFFNLPLHNFDILPLPYIRMAFPNTPHDSDNALLRALYRNDDGSISIIKPTGYNTVSGGFTVNWPVGTITSKILTYGLVKIANWRSVEISIGYATREIAKGIKKLSVILDPLEFESKEGTTIMPEADTYKFVSLKANKAITTLNRGTVAELVDTPIKTTFNKENTMDWRRSFDNRAQEKHYGIDFIGKYVIKSMTALIEYDEVA